MHSIHYVHADNHIDSEAVILKRLEKQLELHRLEVKEKEIASQTQLKEREIESYKRKELEKLKFQAENNK